MKFIKRLTQVFKFKPFSIKQRKVLNWWCSDSPVRDYDGIIADGAIRSGKTVSMSLSFVFWAMACFNVQNFGMCGKTIGSFRRNVLFWLKLMLKSRGYKVEDHRSDNLVIISKGDTENYFYIFGGKDERSQDLIQGITLAGIFFDEVALMPESFINQATGRCSVDGSKFFLNCNPECPNHWFKTEWIDKRKEKKLLYLHFTMDDNLSLSERIKTRYRNMYSGIFYDRFIRGLWILAEGLIYPNYQEAIVKTEPRNYTEYQISIDYGIQNPFAMGLYGLCDGIWYKVKEYHHSGRETNNQKTDAEYYASLDNFAGDLKIRRVIIDPSASSFITLIRKSGKFGAIPANNDVLNGIRMAASAIHQGIVKVNDCCVKSIEEFQMYSWDSKAESDIPIKKNDHHCDEFRYFIFTNKLAVPKRKSLL